MTYFHYKSNYNRLDYLRNYYFQRFDNRDIYAYINLIRTHKEEETCHYTDVKQNRACLKKQEAEKKIQ